MMFARVENGVTKFSPEKKKNPNFWMRNAEHRQRRSRGASWVGRRESNLIQDADNATLHWALEPVRRPKAGTGHGSARPKAGTACTGHGTAGRRPALACTGHGSAGRRPALGTGVPGRRPARPALGTGGPAEGRHWPAFGARRSAVLPAEGRRWLGRRPGTAARAVCARRSEQCAIYGARLSSMRTLYILLYIYILL